MQEKLLTSLLHMKKLIKQTCCYHRVATGLLATGPLATGPLATGPLATGPLATQKPQCALIIKRRRSMLCTQRLSANGSYVERHICCHKITPGPGICNLTTGVFNLKLVIRGTIIPMMIIQNKDGNQSLTDVLWS